MQNTMTDVHNYLVEQLERLNDHSLEGDELKEEIKRSTAMTGVANAIVSNAKLAIDAARFKDSQLSAEKLLPGYLED